MKQKQGNHSRKGGLLKSKLQKLFAQALAHHQAGRLSEAEALYRQILSQDERHVDALHLLGFAAYQTGHFERAVDLIRRAIALSPDVANFHANLANALHVQGMLDEAIASYEKALTLHSRNPELISNLGVALQKKGRLDEAIVRYQQALAFKPDYPEALFNFGNALHAQGKLEKAIQRFEQTLLLHPNHLGAVFNLAVVLQMQGQLDEAIAHYKLALSIKPDYLEGLSNLAGAYQEQGQVNEAIDCCERLLALKPDYAACHRNLSTLKHYTPDDPQIAILGDLYKTAANAADKTHVCFALAKANEDIKAFDQSFALYAEGNRLRKQQLDYTLAQDIALFERIKRHFETLPQAVAIPRHGANPILIVGMTRSGSSLAEQILASHPQVFGAGELGVLNTLAAECFVDANGTSFDLVVASRQMASRYLEALNHLAGSRPFITDKMPLNFRWLGFLLLAQPDLKIVHVRRDPMAVCWSNFKQYFPTNGLGFAYDLDDLAQYYQMYEGLMQFWRERFPGRIYDLNYEQLTEHQEDETRKLLQYCGLSWDERCLAFETSDRAVRTASASQVRHKMYQGSSDAWRKFERHLQPLKRVFEK
ncbi:MAG: tetratricopeptide repeat protein [Zetaproteobacteria bacterium]|nr:tetratricopeptide repeat protein [Zetaproteobacteria bacterium]